MKKLLAPILAVAAALALAGCGSKVEVPPASVGKIMTTAGYKADAIPTSKFRLDVCMPWEACDKLVTLDISDNSYKESMTLFMPADKLEMAFDVRMTLAVAPDKYDEMFNRLPPTQVNGREYKIPLSKAYTVYAQQIIRTEAREYLAQFSIAEIASNREAINAALSEKLTAAIKKRTPFQVQYIALANAQYPEIITQAQERAAERREQIQQEEAQLEISKVQLERQLQEQKMRRAIDLERAQAEAEVNRILADSITPEYITYRSLDALDKIATSDNKVFVPSEMLQSLAGQVAVGNAAGK